MAMTRGQVLERLIRAIGRAQASRGSRSAQHVANMIEMTDAVCMLSEIIAAEPEEAGFAESSALVDGMLLKHAPSMLECGVVPEAESRRLFAALGRMTAGEIAVADVAPGMVEVTVVDDRGERILLGVGASMIEAAQICARPRAMALLRAAAERAARAKSKATPK